MSFAAGGTSARHERSRHGSKYGIAQRTFARQQINVLPPGRFRPTGPSTTSIGTKITATRIRTGTSLPGRTAPARVRRFFFLDHRLDVGAVQRRRRLETVEHDTDGAAIVA